LYKIASVESLIEQNFSIVDIGLSCFNTMFWNIISNKAFKNGSFLSNHLKIIVHAAPRNVVKNLQKIGFTKDMVEWIAAHTGENLTNFILEFYK